MQCKGDTVPAGSGIAARSYIFVRNTVHGLFAVRALL